MSGSVSPSAPQTLNKMPHDRTQDISPEVMTDIFTMVSTEIVRIPTSEDGYPWILGHVCSRWRQILWDAPLIWNKISVGHRAAYVENYKPGDVLSYILSKVAGPILLTASLGRSVLGVILEHFDRFIKLSITGLDKHAMSSIFDLPPSAFAQLESLLLSYKDFSGISVGHNTSPLENAPNLRHVNYATPYQTYFPELLLLPWAAMEVIIVVSMRIPPNVVLDVLRSSPLLRVCHLCIDDTLPTSATPEIVLPALEALELQTTDDFDWEKVLSPIIVPSLTSLNLISPHIPCVPVVSLIVRSHCSLQNLCVSDINLDTYADGTDVESLFDHLPSVVDLFIPWPVPPAIFRKIHSGALSKLTTFEICVHSDGLGAFMDMIDSYIELPRRPFGSFTIVCREDPGFTAQRDRYLARYEAYKEIDGLEIMIMTWEHLVVEPPGDIQ